MLATINSAWLLRFRLAAELLGIYRLWYGTVPMAPGTFNQRRRLRGEGYSAQLRSLRERH